MEGGIEGGKREVEEEGQESEKEGGRKMGRRSRPPAPSAKQLPSLSVCLEWEEGKRAPLHLGSAVSGCKEELPWSADICFKDKTERVTWTSQAVPVMSGADSTMLTLCCHCFCADRKRGLWGPVLLPVICFTPLWDWLWHSQLRLNGKHVAFLF